MRTTTVDRPGRRSDAIDMVGRHDDAGLARARAWVTERADSRATSVSALLLCETAVSRLGVSGAALTVDTSQGWSETLHSTDLLGEQLAEIQVTVGEGPCVDAGRVGGPVLVADLDTAAIGRRWPLFAPLAVHAGARALFALPLRVGSIHAGTLVLHRAEAGSLDATTLTDALAFARLALRLLLDERAGLGGADHDLGDSLSLHDLRVHQATGMISAQLEVGMADAFATLRGRAFADQRPLGELAADVVARRVRFDLTEETT
ncbi:MAG: GAF and ANTAR domain-containing protein [Umezawaea sp.]